MNKLINTVKAHQTSISICLVIFVVFVIIIFNIEAKSNQTKVPSKGILLLNTDKSNYLPGEIMIVSMISLDENGQTLCQSNLKLEITNPQNVSATAPITKSPTCGDNNITNDPDYFASYTLENIGEYKIKLSDLDTKNVLETKIEVGQNLSFDIKRSGAIRLNTSKSNRYPMIITIKANRDFLGQIKDQIPDGLKIVWQGDAKTDGANLVWEVNMKSGETKVFSYEYSITDASSATYTLGPVTIDKRNMGSVWQIVAAK